MSVWVAGLLIAWAAADLGRARAVRAARGAALLIGAGCSLWAILAALRGARGFEVHAGQGNPNWLGLLLAVCLPLSLEWTASRVVRGSVATASAACALTLAEVTGLALSHSRVAWVAAGVTFLWMATSAIRAGLVRLVVSHRGRRGSSVVAIVVAFIVAGTAWGASRAATHHPGGSPEDVSARTSLQGRTWIWQESAAAAVRSPPWGVGLGRFGHAFLTEQGDALQALRPAVAARQFINATTAHQEFLQVAVESGPLATVLLAAALVAAFRGHAARRWIGGSGAVLALGVTCLADSPLRQPAIVLVMALVLGAQHRTLAGTPWGRGRGVLRRGALIFGTCAAAWLATGSTRAWLSTRMRTHALYCDPEARMGWMVRAAATDPTSGEANLALGLEQLARGRPDDALTSLRRSQNDLADIAVPAAMGEGHLALGRYPEAARDFEAALRWHPGFVRASIGLAEAERLLGHYPEAESHALIAATVAPGDARVAEALDRIREARMDAPADASGLLLEGE